MKILPFLPTRPINSAPALARTLGASICQGGVRAGHRLPLARSCGQRRPAGGLGSDRLRAGSATATLARRQRTLVAASRGAHGCRWCAPRRLLPRVPGSATRVWRALMAPSTAGRYRCLRCAPRMCLSRTSSASWAGGGGWLNKIRCRVCCDSRRLVRLRGRMPLLSPAPTPCRRRRRRTRHQ